MTLAFLLFFGAFSVSAMGNGARMAVTAYQSQSADQQSPSTQKQQDSGSAPSPNSTPGASGTSTSTGPPRPSSAQGQAAKNPGKRKKNSSRNCNAAQNPAAKGAATNQASANGKKTESAASSSCPPSKVIVRQGSTSDPNIELVGGAAGPQASSERNTAIQLLQTTETNLKKIDGVQLDSNQQDMIKQVRQFMDQSKAASSAGDLDQARTLAWKAQMLSEELLKAQK